MVNPGGLLNGGRPKAPNWVTIPKAALCIHADGRISVDFQGRWWDPDRCVEPRTLRNSATGTLLQRLMKY